MPLQMFIRAIAMFVVFMYMLMFFFESLKIKMRYGCNYKVINWIGDFSSTSCLPLLFLYSDTDKQQRVLDASTPHQPWNDV